MGRVPVKGLRTKVFLFFIYITTTTSLWEGLYCRLETHPEVKYGEPSVALWPL